MIQQLGSGLGLVAGFIYCLMEVGKGIRDKDWNATVMRLSAILFGTAGLIAATNAHQVTPEFAGLSFWDCLLLSPAAAGYAMGGHYVASGIKNGIATVVTTANPVVPEPALPADPPSDPNAYFESMPRVNDAVRTSNTSHGHVKTAWNAKAEDTIDKNEAKVAKPRKSRAKKPQTAHK